MPKIRRSGGGGGSSCGPALDGDSAIACAVVLVPLAIAAAVIGGVGWLVYKGYLYVVEKVFGNCQHDWHAYSWELFNIRVCDECDAWQTEDKSPNSDEIIRGEWQPSETKPLVCTHFGRPKTFESEEGEIGICRKCGCWSKKLSDYDFDYWRSSATCPKVEQRTNESPV